MEGLQVSAAMLHRGAHTASGHYQSLLRHEKAWFLTDDARSAVPRPATSLPALSKLAYVLLCTEVDHLR